MKKNAYFQLNHISNQLWLNVIPAQDGGSMFKIEELIAYLDKLKLNDYNLVELNQYIKSGEFGVPFLLDPKPHYPETESMVLEITPRAMEAKARFYPPSTEGKFLSKNDIMNLLKQHKVVYGINEKAIDEFLNNRVYCTDIMLAMAKLPVEGKSSEIIYHFDTNAIARPKINEDGSVDFHKLGYIKPVGVGDILATLIPASPGSPGINVIGGELPPRRVRIQRLRYGRNIKLSDNRLMISSMVAGHVTLVDDMVMVSDVFSVPKNVDVSTGDIEYNGSVEIPGNVLAGYHVKADGDIVVNGVVEGAILEAGGNIVLKSGMQGMMKGVLKAKGNIIAKYVENSKIISEGNVMCEAVMHTDIECNGDVMVTGRKGVITGGHVSTYGKIIIANAGSNMGTDTKLEILSDTEMAKKANELEKEAYEIVEQVKKMDQVIVSLQQKVKSGQKLLKEQENFLKVAALNRKKLVEQLNEMNGELDSLKEKLERGKYSYIEVEDTVYAGVKIVIRDVMKIIKDSVRHCRFVREGADVKMSSII